MLFNNLRQLACSRWFYYRRLKTPVVKWSHLKPLLLVIADDIY